MFEVEISRARQDVFTVEVWMDEWMDGGLLAKRQGRRLLARLGVSAHAKSGSRPSRNSSAKAGGKVDEWGAGWDWPYRRSTRQLAANQLGGHLDRVERVESRRLDVFREAAAREREA